MRTTWLWTGVTLALVAAAAFATYRYLQPLPLPEQLLYGNGHIEGTEVRVGAEVSGRVIESRLVEGTAVDRGDLLIRIDDTDLVLQYQRAAAELDTLQSEREKTERQLQVARHHLKTANADMARYRDLRERRVTSPQRLEKAEDAFREARGRVEELTAEVGVIDGRIEAAQKGVRLLQNQVTRTRVRAPVAGTILAKATEVGEYLRPGQMVAVVVDLARLELKAFVPERDIGKITLDDPARIKVDAFPDQFFNARVARVDQQAQFTPRDIHMPQERTRMVFGVTLALDNPDGVLKPGMPADAWILWRPQSGWPDRLFVP